MGNDGKQHGSETDPPTEDPVKARDREQVPRHSSISDEEFLEILDLHMILLAEAEALPEYEDRGMTRGGETTEAHENESSKGKAEEKQAPSQ